LVGRWQISHLCMIGNGWKKPPIRIFADAE
jgi:hypothetical protein